MSSADPHFAAMTAEEKAALPKYPWDREPLPDVDKWTLVNISPRDPSSRPEHLMIAWVICIGGYMAKLYPDGRGISICAPDDCFESWNDLEAVTVAERKALCEKTIEEWARGKATEAATRMEQVAADLKRLKGGEANA